MPTPQTFTDFVNGLNFRAKTQTFSLQVHGKFDCRETRFVRLLRATYQPGADDISGSSVKRADDQAFTQFKVNRAGIQAVLESVASENGTIVTKTTLKIRMPVDKTLRQGFLVQHGLRWDEVDWNDDNNVFEDDWERERSRRRIALVFDEELESGSTDEGHPDGNDRDAAFARSETDQLPPAPSTVVRVRVPSGVSDHGAWLNQHGLGQHSAIWPNVLAGNDRDHLIGVGVEWSIYRGNDRHGSRSTRRFDPNGGSEEHWGSGASLGNGNFGGFLGNGHFDFEGSDEDTEDEHDTPRSATALETPRNEKSTEETENAQRPAEVGGTDIDEELTGGLGGITLRD